MVDGEKKIKELENKIRELELENADCKHRLEENNRVQDEMYFPWAGNLGRWSLNIQTHEVEYNPQKVEVLGYTVEEFDPVYESFTGLIHPEDYEATMEAMRRHLRGEAPAPMRRNTEYGRKTVGGSGSMTVVP